METTQTLINRKYLNKLWYNTTRDYHEDVCFHISVYIDMEESLMKLALIPYKLYASVRDKSIRAVSNRVNF
jgi:hypothetical protein